MSSRNYEHRNSAGRTGGRSAAAVRSQRADSYGYVYGAAARELAHPEEERRRSPAVRPDARPVEAAGSHIPVFFLMGMMLLLTAAVIYYVQLMACVKSVSGSISGMQSQIKTLKTANDQRYEEISNSISIDRIKEIAIGELGMKYADADQVITYDANPDDFVHQVAELNP